MDYLKLAANVVTTGAAAFSFLTGFEAWLHQLPPGGKTIGVVLSVLSNLSGLFQTPPFKPPTP